MSVCGSDPVGVLTPSPSGSVGVQVFQRERSELGRRMRKGRKNIEFSANNSPYLRNDAR